jgi:Rho termination factor, RNA-binding domain
MAQESTRQPTDWGVLHRVLQEDEEHHLLRLLIIGIPEQVGREELKEALEKAGRSYGEGPYRWGNYRLLPRSQWPPELAGGPEGEPLESLTYSDLLDEANGEKRVTLRLPIGLHAALVKASEGRSFNQFCVNTLYAAIHMMREGTLELMPEGWGFLRNTVGEPYSQDVYVSRAQIERFRLQPGDRVRGEVRPPRDGEKYYGLLHVKSVNGQPASSDC